MPQVPTGHRDPLGRNWSAIGSMRMRRRGCRSEVEGGVQKRRSGLLRGGVDCGGGLLELCETGAGLVCVCFVLSEAGLELLLLQLEIRAIETQSHGWWRRGLAAGWLCCG